MRGDFINISWIPVFTGIAETCNKLQEITIYKTYSL